MTSKEQAQPSTFDVFACWKALEKVYPRVAALARKYLVLQASSADVERLFSRAGRIATDLRNRIGAAKD